MAVIEKILLLIFIFFYISSAIAIGIKAGLKSLIDDFIIIKKKEVEENAGKKN